MQMPAMTITLKEPKVLIGSYRVSWLVRIRPEIAGATEDRPYFSLPDAEARKNHPQQILGINLAGDFAEGVEGFAEVDGSEFGVGVLLGEEIEGGGEVGAGQCQGCLVACIDGDGVLAEIRFGEMEGGADFFRKRIEAVSVRAGDPCGLRAFP